MGCADKGQIMSKFPCSYGEGCGQTCILEDDFGYNKENGF